MYSVFDGSFWSIWGMFRVIGFYRHPIFPTPALMDDSCQVTELLLFGGDILAKI